MTDDEVAEGRPAPTQMRVQSVRFSEATWGRIQEEAGLQRVSASQYVREAAIARLWFDLGARGGDPARVFDQMLKLAHEVEERSGASFLEDLVEDHR